MRHKVRGRKLGRNASHRKAMFRNMACSLIRSVRVNEDDSNAPRVPGRIVTTVPKAKELRPIVEKLITLARKAIPHQEAAEKFATTAERNTSEWQSWRNSDQWNKWNQAIAPAVNYRRRAFAQLRDHDAVNILFDELATRFEDRPGGYTRIVKLAEVRLGDAGAQALIEFVGERDRVRRKRKAPVVVADEAATEEETSEESPVADETAESAEAETAETGEGDVGDEATASEPEDGDDTEKTAE